MNISELVLNASEIHATRQDSIKRAYAVAAALEVIALKASQSGAHMTHLDKEFDRLSIYADQIQAALK